MATPYPADDPYLHGGFEPLRMECEYADLCVDGEIPADLRGTLYRIGPSPQFAPRRRYKALSVFHADAAAAVSEGVFVAKSTRSAEGDGYVLATIFNERRNASHLAVFDARRIEAGPVARAHLDHRVPLGFHGSWRPK